MTDRQTPEEKGIFKCAVEIKHNMNPIRKKMDLYNGNNADSLLDEVRKDINAVYDALMKIIENDGRIDANG